MPGGEYRRSTCDTACQSSHLAGHRQHTIQVQGLNPEALHKVMMQRRGHYQTGCEQTGRSGTDRELC